VSVEELEALLSVQERDAALDRLRHRRTTLPERDDVESRRAQLDAKQAALAGVRARRQTVLAEERRLDDESRATGERADDVDKRLYSGSVTSPRELQAMQADLDMLRRQRSDLEDLELEVMEQREALDAEVEGLETEIAALEADVARLRTAIAGAEADIDAAIAEESNARDAAAKPVGDALLRDYERRRTQNKGAGAARLVGTTCQACHLTIPSTEAERIRRAAGNEVAYCDNCSAILVP